MIFFWLWERSAPFDFELSQVEPLTDERLATADGNSVTVGGAITANNRHLETRVLRIVYGETSPFSPLIDIPRYISRDTYLTVYADKSEYFLRLSSLFCFSVEWLPLHWLHTNELRLFNWYTVPLVHPWSWLHNGQLQFVLTKGAYASIPRLMIVLFCCKARYFSRGVYLNPSSLGLKKSTLTPRKAVPFLSYCANSITQIFHLIPGKKM